MGNSLLGCWKRRTLGSLSDLGIPSEYVWDGLAEDKIDEYYETKEKLIEEFERSSGCQVGAHNTEWFQKISEEQQESLKGCLVRRAVGLVHVLRPIEDQRRGLRKLQAKGCMPPAFFESFEKAEEMCSQELKSIMEEGQMIAPDAPPNAFIRTAVQVYDRQGMGRKDDEDDEEDENRDGVGKKSFQNMKGGFFKNEGAKQAVKLAHGFEIGADVQAHSLKTESLNGQVGTVLRAKADRVAVQFNPPIGEKALKPANLKLVPPMPKIHPDATEAPTTKLQVVLQREQGESLGLDFEHEPPLEKQQKGMQSRLVVTGILDGYVKKYNETQQDPEMRLQVGDRILAVVDGSIPEERRRPMGGSSELILRVISMGRTPLIFIVGRVLGPPLRFKVGQSVNANCGAKGWISGAIVKVWDTGKDSMIPYVIRLKNTGDVVCAPHDSDDCVKKGDPRFKVGDEVFANVDGGYKKGKISAVREEGLRTSYSIDVGDPKGTVEAPEDLNQFVRPPARYTVGTKVLARCQNEYCPGTIESVHNPNWVYSVRLDAGHVVYVPEDIDGFMKKRD